MLYYDLQAFKVLMYDTTQWCYEMETLLSPVYSINQKEEMKEGEGGMRKYVSHNSLNSETHRMHKL